MQYAIVTGATFGIGKEIAKALSDKYTVIACGRRVDLIPESKNVIPFKLDITDTNSIAGLVNFISNKTISVLVNCAGGGTSEFKNNILHQSFDDINNDFILNTSSTFNLTKSVIPKMSPSDNPIVINITSIVGHEIFNSTPSYTIAKHSQSVLTSILRRDLAQSNIRVSEIIPSSVNSQNNPDMSDKSLDPSDIADIVYYICNTKKHVDINSISIGHVKEIPFCS